MRVWFLYRTAKSKWASEMTGLVVRAPNERAARALAANMAGDEGADTWTCSRTAKCEPAGEGAAEVIVRGMYED